MPLQLPFAHVSDLQVQANFEAISLAIAGSPTQTKLLSGTGTLDVAILSTDALIVIEWDVELSGLAELRLFPNASGAANYSDIRDGSYQTSGPTSVAVAAAGAVNHNNGIRLSYAPTTSIAGGVKTTGRAVLGTGVPPTGSRRLCRGDAAVSSLIGSSNHVIELQNIATLWNDATAVTSLRFIPNTGSMSGRIRVTRG
jgi:hypothetical protein